MCKGKEQLLGAGPLQFIDFENDGNATRSDNGY